MILLETSLISELRKPKPHAAALQGINAVADADLHLSVVSIGAIQAGIER
jgi:predicted nucleic acid-binding protein